MAVLVSAVFAPLVASDVMLPQPKPQAYPVSGDFCTGNYVVCEKGQVACEDTTTYPECNATLQPSTEETGSCFYSNTSILLPNNFCQNATSSEFYNTSKVLGIMNQAACDSIDTIDYQATSNFEVCYDSTQILATYCFFSNFSAVPNCTEEYYCSIDDKGRTNTFGFTLESSACPNFNPTSSPTAAPTNNPTNNPTASPTPPTDAPTFAPTPKTTAPTAAAPTAKSGLSDGTIFGIVFGIIGFVTIVSAGAYFYITRRNTEATTFGFQYSKM